MTNERNKEIGLTRNSKSMIIAAALLACAAAGLFLVGLRQFHKRVSPRPPALSKVATPPQAGRFRRDIKYGKHPLSFEENQGQTNSQVKYLLRGSSCALFLTNSEAVLSLRKIEKHEPHQQAKVIEEPFRKISFQRGLPYFGQEAQTFDSSIGAAEITTTVLRMKLLGAAQAKVTGIDPLAARSNYFIGNDPAKWRVNVPHFARVRYQNVYRGIDLVYYGKERQLEYDFVIAPGADPRSIRLEFEGADQMALDKRGNLLLTADGDQVVLNPPDVYQQIHGTRKPIPGQYALLGSQQVGFQVGSYDTSQPLIIDPVLVYSTYLGGNQEDVASAIAVDSAGSAYVAGWTLSSNFTVNAFQRTRGGSTDAFVTKFNPQGSGIIYSTYLGGSGRDQGQGIAVDSAGNAYVTGLTGSTNFPILNAFQTANKGGSGGDAFVTKLNASGTALIFSTYLGGTGNGQTLIDSGDQGEAIAADASGNTYVAGTTDSANFPTVNPLQAQMGGGQKDAFLAKFDPTGRVLYSTFVGGADIDRGHGIAADNFGNAYITGTTASRNFPVANALQRSFHEPPFTAIVSDAFVAKVNPSGSAFIYSTYLGGFFDDQGNGIGVDSTGNVYVTGLTSSPDFPAVHAVQPLNNGGFIGDAFLTKLNPSGSAVVYSTFLGGEASGGFTDGGDVGKGIAVDAFGNAVIVGQTTSPNFPIVNAVQSKYAGPAAIFDSSNGGDVFVAKFNAVGSLAMSTFLGGSKQDFGGGVAVDSTGNIYVAGSTRSTDFPTAVPFQPVSGGGSQGFFGNDGFVTKINPGIGAVIIAPEAGAFLPPIPEQPWTRFARLDTNGNGIPDPNDSKLGDVRRSLNTLSFSSDTYPSSRGPGQKSITLSNPNSRGKFEAATRNYTDFFISHTFSDTLQVTRSNANGNPIEWTATEQRTPFTLVNGIVTPSGPPRTWTFTFALIPDNSGVYKSLSVEGTTLPKVTLDLVLVDVNNDGKPDFVTIPWALAAALGVNNKQTPQIFFPLVDTDGDGIPDSIALDFDGDGTPDPDLAVGPPMVARSSATSGTSSQSFAIAERRGISLTTLGTSPAAVVGYARIQPNPGSTTPAGLAIFGLRQGGVLVTEAGVPASPLIRSGRIYATVEGQANTGVAIANPNDQQVVISYFFTDANGVDSGAGLFAINAHNQIAVFLNQPPFNGPSSFNGTLTFTSDLPVAAIALRGFNNERSEFLITTLPVADLSVTSSDAFIFTHFADGGGWITQAILVNPTDDPITGTMQFMGQGTATAPAQPVSVTVEGQTGSTFNYTIPPRSSRRFRTSGSSTDARAGSIRVTPSPNNKAPSGLAIFSFKNAGITVTEAAVPALRAATAHRMYAELSGPIQTGVAAANPSPNPVTVTFEATPFGPGAPTVGTATVPGSGEIALFMSQIPGLESLSSSFQGVLRISTNSAAGVSVVGLRGRANERGDFLITTTPPVNENSAPSMVEALFPHLADGGGYTIQFILFGGSAGQSSNGILRFFRQTGQPLNLVLR
ncbi:MAG TPA: SBBP repeat-containing protein [Acidobacteriota bacterium]|jgi:hypothetical protein|nr:SBBP repeat-containing protein [Acidobacteriota bacterium]